MWRWLLALAVISGAVIGVFLGALNPDRVTVELAFIRWTASLGSVVALSACAGLVAGFTLAMVFMMARRRARPTVPATTSEVGKRRADA